MDQEEMRSEITALLLSDDPGDHERARHLHEQLLHPEQPAASQVGVIFLIDKQDWLTTAKPLTRIQRVQVRLGKAIGYFLLAGLLWLVITEIIERTN